MTKTRRADSMLTTVASDKHCSDYISLVKSFLTRVSRRQFRPLAQHDTRKGEWVGKFQVTQNLAFINAVLHRFTGQVKYLSQAKKNLLDFDQGSHFHAVLLGLAYELIQGSLSDDQRQSFAQAWTADAGEQLHKFILGYVDNDVEAIRPQVTNHVICACIYADYVRHLFPKIAAPYAYRRVTDKFWDAFWSTREYPEQATNYEGFPMAAICFWAQLRGAEKEFYRTPTILNILHRAELITSPAGIVTAYGDSENNAHSCSWLPLFERFATRTRNGQLKTIAADVLKHLLAVGLREMPEQLDAALEENIYNARVMYGGFLGHVANIALAALWTDPSLKGATRDDPAGVVRRMPTAYRLSPSQRRKLPTKTLEPCHIALTGGPVDSRERSYVLVSVGRQRFHDHADAGGLAMFSKGHTTLLAWPGYFQRELLYHHTFYAQPKRWPNYPEDDHRRVLEGDPHLDAQMTQLRLAGDSSSCEIEFDRYHNLPLSLTRQVRIEPDGSVLITDCAQAEKRGYIGGPLFHAQRIRRLSNGCFLLRCDELPCGGQYLSNPAGSLLVEFLDDDVQTGHRRLKYSPGYNMDFYKGFPTCHYKKLWKRGYGARRCLYAHRSLPVGSETVFRTRLTPVDDS